VANVSYGSASWSSASESHAMQSGESHGWLWTCNNGTEAVSISAHPSASWPWPPVDGPPPTRYMTVENVLIESGRVEVGITGDRVNFQVRNAGSNPILGYTVAVSFVWD
jgi:hypothetical protein